MVKNLKTLIVLLKAQANIEQHIKTSLGSTSLSVNEFTALEALYNKGSLSAQELTGLVLIPNSSMTYVLDNLEKKGLINRQRDEADRRVYRSSLTEEGQRAFPEIYATHYEHMRTVFDVLTPEEEVQLQELLKKLGKHAEETLA